MKSIWKKIAAALTVALFCLLTVIFLVGCANETTDSDSNKDETTIETEVSGTENENVESGKEPTEGGKEPTEGGKEPKVSVREFLAPFMERYAEVGIPSFDNLPQEAYYVDGKNGEGAIFCPDETVEKYENYLKQAGFEKVSLEDDGLYYRIEDKDVGLQLTIGLVESKSPDPVGVGLIFYQDIPRYVLQDLGENFRISFTYNGFSYKLYRVEKDFYFEKPDDGIGFYFQGTDEGGFYRTYAVYTHETEWCGWFQYQPVNDSEIYEFFESMLHAEGVFKILTHNPFVTYTYSQTDEKIIDRATKKYTEVAIDTTKAYTEEFFTDAETNLCLSIRKVFPSYTDVIYTVEELLVGGVTIPSPEPALDSPVAFPIAEVRKIGGYDFPAYEGQIYSTWMYGYKENDKKPGEYDVTVYGLNGEEYNQYMKALEDDGFTYENNVGEFIFTKKDLTNKKLYKCSLYFENGTSIRNKYTVVTHSYNKLHMKFWTEDYVKSTWPVLSSLFPNLYSWYYESENDAEVIPEFVTEDAIYTVNTSTPRARTGYNGCKVITVKNYTAAELKTWTEAVVAADGGIKYSDTEFGCDGSAYGFFIELFEDRNKTQVEIKINVVYGRRTFPTKILSALFPDMPTLSDFELPNSVQYALDYQGFFGGIDRWEIEIFSYTTADVEKIRPSLFEKMGGLEEYVAACDDLFYYAPVDKGVLYRVEILHGGLMVNKMSYRNDFYWEKIPTNSPVYECVLADLTCKHIFDATYTYTTAEGTCTLNCTSYGWTNNEAESFKNKFMGEITQNGTRSENGSFCDRYRYRIFKGTEEDALGDLYNKYEQWETTVTYKGYDKEYSVYIEYRQTVLEKAEK